MKRYIPLTAAALLFAAPAVYSVIKTGGSAQGDMTVAGIETRTETSRDLAGHPFGDPDWRPFRAPRPPWYSERLQGDETPSGL